MDAAVLRAIGRSELAGLPDAVLNELTADSRLASVPAGTATHVAGDPTPHLDLVVSGLIKIHVGAEDGRTVTVRYCRPGALIGVTSLFSRNFVMPATSVTIEPSRLLSFRPEIVRRCTARHPAVAEAFLRELSDRVNSFISEIPDAAFGSVRQRVVRHLLDLADDDGVAVVRQGELADAVGSVREVVVRVLRELRTEGLVRTERDQIVVVDPTLLARHYVRNLGS